jgi:hypothetical protein
MRRIAGVPVLCRRMPCFTVSGRANEGTIQALGPAITADQSEEHDGRTIFPGRPPPVRPPKDRLDSWKEIAAYLNREVTTVQRWEKRAGMPVHRHLQDRMRSVYASRTALDAWSRGRNLRVAQEDENSALIANPSAPPRRSEISTLEPDGTSSCHWQRRESHWPLALASGCSGSSTSGGNRC